MQITINRNGENYGPYSLEQVREMLDSGQAQPTDMGHVEGESEWVPLSELSKTCRKQRKSRPLSVHRIAIPIPQPVNTNMNFVSNANRTLVITVQVPANQTLKVEASAMATMSTNMVMKTK